MPMRAFIVLHAYTPDDGPLIGRSATVYEVDFESAQGTPVRQALRQYVRTVSKGARSLPGDEDTSATVRKWAKEQGIPVSDRGRIPDLVWQQFYDYQLNHGIGGGSSPKGGRPKGSSKSEDDGKSTAAVDDDAHPPGKVIELRARRAGA